MPLLGKRPKSSTLRLNLDPKAHLQAPIDNNTRTEYDTNSEYNSEPADRTEEGQRSQKRAKTQLFIQSALNQRNAVGNSITQSSNNSGCLSPTDSPVLLEESLRRAAEVQKKQKNEEHLENIGRYCLLSALDSAGYCYHALDIQSQQLKTCQVLSNKTYDHLVKVSERLNSNASYNWPYTDTEEMIEKILPSKMDLIKHKDGKCYLFTEKHHGSLHTLVQSKKKLRESEAKLYFGQIVRLVAFCHSLGIVVRDLKLRKFVFADENQLVLRLGSVSDLVVCSDLSDDQLSDRHGCPAYVSPEILDLHRRTYSGKSADIWSLGVMLFVMLVGRYPFYASTPSGLFGKIRHGRFAIPTDEKLRVDSKNTWLLKFRI